MALFGRAQIMGGRQTQGSGSAFNDAVLAFGSDVVFLTDLRKVGGSYPSPFDDESGNGHTCTSAGAVSDFAGPDGETYPEYTNSAIELNYGDHADFSITSTEGRTLIMIVQSRVTTNVQNLLHKTNGASTWEYTTQLVGYNGSTAHDVRTAVYSPQFGDVLVRREDTTGDPVIKDDWNLIVVAWPAVTGTASNPVTYVNSNSAQATSDTTSSNTAAADSAAPLKFGNNGGPSGVDFQGVVARLAMVKGQLDSSDVQTLVDGATDDGFI